MFYLEGFAGDQLIQRSATLVWRGSWRRCSIKFCICTLWK